MSIVKPKRSHSVVKETRIDAPIAKPKRSHSVLKETRIDAL